MIPLYYLAFRKASPITKAPDLLLIETKFPTPPVEFAMTEKISRILTSFVTHYDIWHCRLCKLDYKDIYIGNTTYYLNAATGYYERSNLTTRYLFSNLKYIAIKII